MKGVEFSQGPLMMRLNNYNDDPLRIYVQVTLESEADFAKIQQLKEQLNEIEPGISMAEAADDPDFVEEFSSLSLDNPFPMMCNLCKKTLAADVFRNAEFPKANPTCASTSKRTEQAKFDLNKQANGEN
jgi:hypothetical protein